MNLLNLALMAAGEAGAPSAAGSTAVAAGRVRSALMVEERALMAGVMALLDHSVALLRAKGAVAVALICRCVGSGVG